MDDNKIFFSSEWDIDQIVQQDTVVVNIPSGSTWNDLKEVVDISHLDLDYVPQYQIVTRPHGTTKWNMQGAGARSWISFTSPPYPTMLNDKLYVYGGDPGESYDIRYYIFKRPAVTE